MKNAWQEDNCTNIHSYFSLYPVAVAAALWCGVPMSSVDKYLKEAATENPAVFRHPQIKCLEIKCRAIHNAIDSGILPVSRENGRIITEHVAPGRRHVSRQNLKDWIAKEFPSNKPEFLFDEVERKSHSAINADSFRALQADRDAAQAEIKRMEAIISNLTKERDALLGENSSLKSIVERNNRPGERSETTYLNIIGGLLELMLKKSPLGKPTFISQAAIISALLAHYEHKPGIAARTLEEKFAAANQSLESS